MPPNNCIFMRNKCGNVSEKRCHDIRHTAGASSVIPFLIPDNLSCSEIIYL